MYATLSQNIGFSLNLFFFQIAQVLYLFLEPIDRPPCWYEFMQVFEWTLPK